MGVSVLSLPLFNASTGTFSLPLSPFTTNKKKLKSVGEGIQLCQSSPEPGLKKGILFFLWKENVL